MLACVFPSRTVDREELDAKGNPMVPTMYYQRGTEIVKQKGTTAIAVRGIMEVRGQCFDTIERAGGFVYLREMEIPYVCRMEESKGEKHKGRRQIRPRHTIHNNENRIAAILIHAGSRPTSFIGCIGVGRKSSEGLSGSEECMKELFRLLGEFKSGAEVWLKVSGEMPET